MGDFAADTLRDTLFSGWAPSNTRIPKAESAGIEHYCHILAHPQIVGAHEWPIAIEVAKILDPQVPDNENQTVHTLFTEVTHRFTITCRRRVNNIDETLFDQAQQDIEDMCVEVVRILKTVYNPLSGTGAFFTARYDWINNDNLEVVKQELIRKLTFELKEIQSQSTEVFRGNTGVLVFDDSATTADSKPGSDYTYTEVFNVSVSDQGYDVIPELIYSGTAAKGVPIYFSGEFSGSFSADTFVKKSDIDNSTIESLDNIYKLQSNSPLAGEFPLVTFLHSVDNTEGTPVTFTESIPLIGIHISKDTSIANLVKFTITATISAPTAYTVA